MQGNVITGIENIEQCCDFSELHGVLDKRIVVGARWRSRGRDGSGYLRYHLMLVGRTEEEVAVDGEMAVRGKEKEGGWTDVDERGW